MKNIIRTLSTTILVFLLSSVLLVQARPTELGLSQESLSLGELPVVEQTVQQNIIPEGQPLEGQVMESAGMMEQPAADMETTEGIAPEMPQEEMTVTEEEIMPEAEPMQEDEEDVVSEENMPMEETETETETIALPLETTEAEEPNIEMYSESETTYPETEESTSSLQEEGTGTFVYSPAGQVEELIEPEENEFEFALEQPVTDSDGGCGCGR